MTTFKKTTNCREFIQLVYIIFIFLQGQLTSTQLWTYFKDLQDPDFKTYFAIVHARFSTNTFPTWERAHPMRYIYYM